MQMCPHRDREREKDRWRGREREKKRGIDIKEEQKREIRVCKRGTQEREKGKETERRPASKGGSEF